MARRRLLIALVTVGLLVLAVLPAVVTFAVGWLQLPQIQPWGAPAADDPTRLEVWAAFAVFYLFWMLGLMVLLVWSFDRLGHHWHFHERPPRPAKKQRRRVRATMKALAAEEQAAVESLRRRDERDARRRDREARGRSGEGG
jgi:type VI protein secretion system component VasK